MQEFLNFIARKLKIKQLPVSPSTDKIFKWVKYVIVIALVGLWTFGVNLGNFSLWNIFGIYSSPAGWSNLSSLLTFGGFSLLTILILSLFVERGFCTYFCPLGAAFTVVSKFRIFKIKKDKSTCIECNLCTRKCPMRIEVNNEMNTYGKVISGECIDCGNCISSCPPHSIFTPQKAAVAGTIASVLIAGIYLGGTYLTYAGVGSSLGNSGASLDGSVSDAISESISGVQGQYVDGTYTGSATGYRGETKVTVVVSNNKISSITVDSYKDDKKFFEMASSTTIDRILSN
jgi:uncharacterized protein with FMN-binding domain/ferredoxin